MQVIRATKDIKNEKYEIASIVVQVSIDVHWPAICLNNVLVKKISHETGF